MYFTHNEKHNVEFKTKLMFLICASHSHEYALRTKHYSHTEEHRCLVRKYFESRKNGYADNRKTKKLKIKTT